MLLGYTLPVIANLGALGVLFAPLRVRRKCGLVDVRGNITSDTWIDVFVPGSTLYCQFTRWSESVASLRGLRSSPGWST